jgi:Fe-S-cluster containining protein
MEKQLTLTEIFDKTGGDKGSYFVHKNTTTNLAHNYTETYEKYMSDFRHKNINFLEIGLWCPFFPGASVSAWNEYFTNLNYFGIDIVDCTHLNKEKIEISVVDQKDYNQLNDYLLGKEKFKFIIDDGCHEEDAIIISLGNLFPHLEPGGFYFIEDLHVVDKTNLYRLKENKFYSDLLSSDQVDFLNDNIDTCVFANEDKLCIIKKKN